MRKFFDTLFKSPILNLFVLTIVLIYSLNVFEIFFFKHILKDTFLNLFKSFFTILLVNLVITHLLYLLSFKFFSLVYKIYAFVVFVLVFTDLFLLLNLQTSISIVILDVIFNTNLQEALEFSQTFFSTKFLILIFATATLFVFLTNKKWGGGCEQV